MAKKSRTDSKKKLRDELAHFRAARASLGGPVVPPAEVKNALLFVRAAKAAIGGGGDSDHEVNQMLLNLRAAKTALASVADSEQSLRNRLAEASKQETDVDSAPQERAQGSPGTRGEAQAGAPAKRPMAARDIDELLRISYPASDKLGSDPGQMALLLATIVLAEVEGGAKAETAAGHIEQLLAEVEQGADEETAMRHIEALVNELEEGANEEVALRHLERLFENVKGGTVEDEALRQMIHEARRVTSEGGSARPEKVEARPDAVPRAQGPAPALPDLSFLPMRESQAALQPSTVSLPPSRAEAAVPPAAQGPSVPERADEEEPSEALSLGVEETARARGAFNDRVRAVSLQLAHSKSKALERGPEPPTAQGPFDPPSPKGVPTGRAEVASPFEDRRKKREVAPEPEALAAAAKRDEGGAKPGRQRRATTSGLRIAPLGLFVVLFVAGAGALVAGLAAASFFGAGSWYIERQARGDERQASKRREQERDRLRAAERAAEHRQRELDRQIESRRFEARQEEERRALLQPAAAMPLDERMKEYQERVRDHAQGVREAIRTFIEKAQFSANPPGDARRYRLAAGGRDFHALHHWDSLEQHLMYARDSQDYRNGWAQYRKLESRVEALDGLLSRFDSSVSALARRVAKEVFGEVSFGGSGDRQHRIAPGLVYDLVWKNLVRSAEGLGPYTFELACEVSIDSAKDALGNTMSADYVYHLRVHTADLRGATLAVVRTAVPAVAFGAGPVAEAARQKEMHLDFMGRLMEKDELKAIASGVAKGREEVRAQLVAVKEALSLIDKAAELAQELEGGCGRCPKPRLTAVSLSSESLRLESAPG